jgi:drug/metabolite transporter (DMT)-like permease
VTDRQGSPYFLLALAVVFISVGSILVRLTPAPALAVAFYRIAVATVIVAPFALGETRRSLPALDPRARGLVLGAGGALALHFAAWISSLSHTSIASSVLLVNTAPVFTVVLARVFLHERVTPRVLTAIALALAGAVVIAAGDWGRQPASLFGNLLAGAGAATLAVYHVVGRGLRNALPLRTYVFLVWAVAAAALAAIAIASGAPFGPYPPRTWLLFLALGLFPTVLGHGLVNRSLRSVAAPTVGLFLLGEPVGASILAFLVFAEVPSLTTLAGGLVILVALALVVLRPEP